MAIVIGIDIAKRSFDIATLQPNGKHRTKGGITNDPKGFELFEHWLKTHAEPGCWIVLEATGIYHEALADYFHARGYQLCVMNPAQIASYGQSQLQRGKTDKLDAKLIATYGDRHQDQLRRWTPEAPGIRRLRALTRRVGDLKELQQMERNRLDVADSSVQPSIQAVLQRLDEQITQTLKQIDQHIDDDPDLRGKRDLLTSIDGLGDKTAALLLAELGDPLRFSGAGAVTAFAGLNPRLNESGRYQGRTTLSRMGNARLRAGFYMPAVCSLQHNPVIKAMSERLKARGKAGKQIVCAAMRKLLTLAYGVLKSGVPFDPNWALAR